MLHTKFQASKPSGSEEEVFSYFFSMYYYASNEGPPGVGHVCPWDRHLNKLGKDL